MVRPAPVRPVVRGGRKGQDDDRKGEEEAVHERPIIPQSFACGKIQSVAMMNWAILALGVLASFQDDFARKAREWVERLRSEKVEDREEARQNLKGLGRAAVQELEKAVKSP